MSGRHRKHGDCSGCTGCIPVAGALAATGLLAACVAVNLALFLAELAAGKFLPL